MYLPIDCWRDVDEDLEAVLTKKFAVSFLCRQG
jgi:hypothetical protein